MSGHEIALGELRERIADDVANVEIVLVSSGHLALDHRVFDKEAVSLAKYFPRVRVVAAHAGNEMRQQVAITGLPPSRHRLERFLIRPLRCFLAARGVGPRLVILHDAELLWWVPLVRLMTGWRVIYDVHEDFAQLLLRRPWISPAMRRQVSCVIEGLEKACSRLCDGIIGVTDVLVDKFKHARRIALYNLPSGAFLRDAALFARPMMEREYDIVHHGVLSAERLAFLQAVLSHLFVRAPDARALVIGVTPAQQAQLRAAFSDDRLTLRGRTAYGEIGQLLGACRIGINIHPVLYQHLRCAVPVKVFEYMAAGCNVVTSYLPELHHLLGEDGIDQVSTIYTPDAERFAEEIVRLLGSEEQLMRHQEALMRLVGAHWNWESEEQKLVRFVLDVMQRTPGRRRVEMPLGQR